jgi:hypothetical protein
MKKWKVIGIALFVIFAAADSVLDFIQNDGFHYFAAQPIRWLWVAVISIGGGLSTLIVCRLSPRWQRRAKLLALGLAASCLTALAGYFTFMFVRWSSWFGVSNSPVFFFIVPPCAGCGAVWLWFAFCRVSRKRVL